MIDKSNHETRGSIDNFIFKHAKAGAHPWSSVPHLRAVGKLFGVKAVDNDVVMLDLDPDNYVNSLLYARNNPSSQVYIFCRAKAKYDWINDLASAEKLVNVKVGHEDLEKFIGKTQLDYMIVEKTLSATDDAAAEAMWRIAHNNLSKNGLVFLEYETVPGVTPLQCARDILTYHARGATDPEERYRQSIALLKFITEDSGAKHPEWYKNILTTAAEEFKQQTDNAGRVYEKYLQPGRSFRFDQVVTEAMSHGLQFVGEADFASMYLEILPEGAREQLKKLNNIVDAEQYKDLVTCRGKRRSIFCKGGLALNRKITEENIIDLHIINLMQTETPEQLEIVSKDNKKSVTFRVSNSEVKIDNYLFLNTLYILESKWRRSPVKIADLIDAVVKATPGATLGDKDVVQSVIMQMVLHGAAFLYDGVESFETEKDRDVEKPLFSPLIRESVVKGDLLPSIYYHNTRVDDLTRFIIQKSDGKTSLAKIVEEAITQGKLQIKDDQGKEITEPETVKRAVREGAVRSISGLWQNSVI